MTLRSTPEARAWLAKAESDLRMAQLAMNVEDPLFDQACFHFQQAGEKSLKALLVFAGLPVLRTHDLFLLIETLSVAFPDIVELAEKAALLTQYGISPRYPSFLASEDAADAAEALEAAVDLHDFVRRTLKEP